MLKLTRAEEMNKIMSLSENAKYILKQRYLKKDENRETIESPRQLFRRVARAIAEVDLKYGKTKEEIKKEENDFLNMMIKFEFLPNSPTLMNAGTNLGQLSACLSLDTELLTKYGWKNANNYSKEDVLTAEQFIKAGKSS